MEEVMLALSSLGSTLAIIGLVVGLVVFALVIFLLQSTLTPLRRVLADVENANTAPMLQRGVPGTDQLGQTRRLADSVPPLALAYLAKLGLAGKAAAPAPAHTFAAAPPPPPPPPPTAQPSPQQPAAPSSLPAWKVFSGQ
jgi:hypothetical protein